MEYDSEGNVTKMTDADNGVTSYKYNGNGKVTEIKLPDGMVENLDALVGGKSDSGSLRTDFYVTKDRTVIPADKVKSYSQYDSHVINGLQRIQKNENNYKYN